MSKRIFACLSLALACAFLLAACGGSETNTSTTNSTNMGSNTATTMTPAATPAATATTPANTTPANTSTSNKSASAGEKIGIAECDDFLTKYEACVTGKVPAAARAQYEASLKQWRDSWRQMAANPQTKSTLASACKMSMEQSKTSLKSFGCEW